MNKKLKAILLTLVAIFSIPLGVFAFIFLATSEGATLPSTVETDPQIPRVTLEKTIFHVETFGDPTHPVLMVLHDGPGGDFKSLLPLKALADSHYVVFYDQRGSGLSQRVKADTLTIEQYQKDLESMIAHYAGERPLALLGHGWGGMMATAYAAEHPQKVTHLILADPGFLTTHMAHKVLGKMSTVSTHTFLTTAKTWVQSFHLKGNEPDMQTDFVLGKIRQTPMYFCGDTVNEGDWPYWRAGFGAWKQITQSTFDEDRKIKLNFANNIQSYPNPVLFLVAECNELTGPAFQQEQMKLFKSPQMKVLSQTGHMMFTENPHESVGAVRDYLMR